MAVSKNFIFPIALAFIASLPGCSEPSRQNKNIKDRQIRNRITEQVIDTTSDNNLVYAVYDNLIAKCPEDYTKEYETVMNWTKSQQAIFVICLLDGEVNNGGFNQYYYNSSGQYADITPNALTLIGAHKFADLVTRANQTYQKEKNKIIKSQDGTAESFSKSYDSNPLEKFDNEFYALEKTDNLQQLEADFIKKHKQDFIDN